jgi:hypothetical protein
MPRLAPLACAVLLTVAPFGANAVHAADSVDTTLPTSPDSTFVYDIEKEPSDCIGFLPKPGCGKKPQQAGDRGGSLQYLTFLVMISGVSIIGTVLIRNVMKRDRAIAAKIAEDEKTSD